MCWEGDCVDGEDKMRAALRVDRIAFCRKHGPHQRHNTLLPVTMEATGRPFDVPTTQRFLGLKRDVETQISQYKHIAADIAEVLRTTDVPDLEATLSRKSDDAKRLAAQINTMLLQMQGEVANIAKVHGSDDRTYQ